MRQDAAVVWIKGKVNRAGKMGDMFQIAGTGLADELEWAVRGRKT